mmetsp:Transcript_6161/g.16416  ORF Transcript_6161/g.16416 Transcript_6161/m.16416 type:complete len:296 (+) Transcript_6161:826-1713(+)
MGQAARRGRAAERNQVARAVVAQFEREREERGGGRCGGRRGGRARHAGRPQGDRHAAAGGGSSRAKEERAERAVQDQAERVDRKLRLGRDRQLSEPARQGEPDKLVRRIQVDGVVLEQSADAVVAERARRRARDVADSGRKQSRESERELAEHGAAQVVAPEQPNFDRRRGGNHRRHARPAHDVRKQGHARVCVGRAPGQTGQKDRRGRRQAVLRRRRLHRRPARDGGGRRLRRKAPRVAHGPTGAPRSHRQTYHLHVLSIAHLETEIKTKKDNANQAKPQSTTFASIRKSFAHV